MKHKSYLFLLISIIFFSCERDDICTDVALTTPRLLIEFFDATDTDETKIVTRLSVYADSLVTGDLPTTAAEAQGIAVTFNENLIFNTNNNILAVPLLFPNEGVETTTRYIFERDTNLRLDNDPNTNSNIDILEIRYTPEFIYVSRACGYKSTFTNTLLAVEAGDDGVNWIQSTTFANTTETTITVENEDATHVQIFH